MRHDVEASLNRMIGGDDGEEREGEDRPGWFEHNMGRYK
jgi:hypothetical protein